MNLLIEIKEILLDQKNNHKEILNSNEASQFLGISRHTLHQLTSRNKIIYYKPTGKLLYFKKSDLEKFLLKNKIEAQ